jgi:hypothetical protein
MENPVHPHSSILKVTDQQWLDLVEMLTYNVLALNSRVLSTVELMYRDGGHYPVFHFRLTSVLEDPTDNDLKPEVSGFSFGYDPDMDDEVYIQPLSPDGYWEDFLEEIGITHFFTSNEVGMKKLYKFLSENLKMWNDEIAAHITIPEPYKWRSLLTVPVS